MIKGKKLPVVLMTALTLVIVSAGIAYAATQVDHDASHRGEVITSSAENEDFFNIRCTYKGSGDVECALKEWHYLKITPVDSAPVYDRSRHGAKFQLSLNGEDYNDINEDNPIPAGVIAGEITYVGRGSTSYNSTTAPTEAGKYSATSAMTDAVLPESLTIITTDFEIKPLEVVSSWDSTSFKYDGNKHVPEISFTELCGNDKVAIESITYTRKSDNTTVTSPTAAGTYTATATVTLPSANYKWSDSGELTKTTSVDFTIDPIEVRVQWGDTSLKFNGNEQYPAAAVNPEDLLSGDTCEVTSIGSYADEACETEKMPSVDAGAYWAKAETLSNENYVIKAPAASDSGIEYYDRTSYEIGKIPLIAEANPAVIRYGDDPANAGVTYTGLAGGPDAAPVDESEISYSYDYVKYGKPGTYTINVSGLNSDNYEITYKPGTLTVNDRVSTLVARGSKSGKRAIALSWNSVTDAASYDVYASKCNGGKKKNAPAYIGTTASTGYKVKKIGKKKLQAKTAYKFYVVAKDASGIVIARSRTGHFITGNVKGNLVNAKSMTVNTNSATISKGGTFALNAAYKKCRNGKKYKLINNRHAALTRYISEQPAVATVDANGIVTGVSTGWCRIYVQGVSGMWEVVEINVN